MTGQSDDADFLCFDTETTGVNVETDRIVTATCALVGASGVKSIRNWLINPGVPIPDEASKIHGITTEKAQADGRDPVEALSEIAQVLTDAWYDGAVLVAMNAAFDLSILLYEFERHRLPGVRMGPVIDPLVLDRHYDKYRKGKRNLAALAEHYGVRLDNAHSSEGDALAAGRIAWVMERRYPELATMPIDDIQRLQAEAHRAWAENYQSYLRGKGQTDAVIETDWPVRRRTA